MATRKQIARGEVEKFVDPDRKEKIEQRKVPWAGPFEADEIKRTQCTEAWDLMSPQIIFQTLLQMRHKAAEKITAILRGVRVRRDLRRGRIDKYVDALHEKKVRFGDGAAIVWPIAAP